MKKKEAKREAQEYMDVKNATKDHIYDSYNQTRTEEQEFVNAAKHLKKKKMKLLQKKLKLKKKI